MMAKSIDPDNLSDAQIRSKYGNLVAQAKSLIAAAGNDNGLKKTGLIGLEAVSVYSDTKPEAAVRMALKRRYIRGA